MSERSKMSESKLFNPRLNRRQFLGALLAGSAVLATGGLMSPRLTRAAEVAKGPFSLPPLPYAENALDPYISAQTIGFHYGKHHQGYVNKLNELVAGTPLAEQSLEAVIQASAGKADQVAIFNNAAQVWNHTFYWKSMSPNGGGAPTGELADQINSAFGSLDGFKEKFAEAGTTQFGSGWAWLIQGDSGLEITKTANADLPLKHGQKALLTMDVWEHAYYIDFRNARPNYISNFLDNLINWDFAAANLAS